MSKVLSESMKMVALSGAGQLNKAAITPFALRRTNEKVVIITTKEVPEEIQTVTLTETIGTSKYKLYPIKTAENWQFFMEHDINGAALVSRDNPMIFDILADCNMIFSACREGTGDYVELFNKVSFNENTALFVVDNNPQCYQIAKEKNANPRLTVVDVTIHAVCTQLKPPDQVYTLHSPLDLVFSPEALPWKKYFKLFNSQRFNYSILFTESPVEYEVGCKIKLGTVNGVHSYVCVDCYENGVRNGMDVVSIAKTPIGDLSNKTVIIEEIKLIFDLVLNDILSPYNDEEKKMLSNIYEFQDRWKITLDFINHLFDGDENVGRGLDPSKETDFAAKKERHLMYLLKILQTQLENTSISHRDRLMLSSIITKIEQFLKEF